MNTVVRPLTRSRRDRVRFWRAGLSPYEGDPHFVVPLLAEMHARWSDAHPFFRHADVQHFVAVRDGRDVGRVASVVDHEYDKVHRPEGEHGGDDLGAAERIGGFGWFECDDGEAARALLDAAAGWLRERGRTHLRGPLSYTTNGISGLLVQDREPGPPAFDIAYNPARYAAHLEDWGLRPAMDLLAFWVPADAPDERLRRVAARGLARGGLTLRPIRTDRAGFADDVAAVQHVYNGAWEQNWGFVPMTPEEIRAEARSMRPVLEPSLVLLAERDGAAVGFSLALPDLNQALGRIRGRLWPWSALRVKLGLGRIDAARVLTLGVLPEARRNGVETALVLRTIDAARDLGYRGGECSWILADNVLMIRAIERVGGRLTRTYRVFQAPLPG